MCNWNNLNKNYTVPFIYPDLIPEKKQPQIRPPGKTARSPCWNKAVDFFHVITECSDLPTRSDPKPTSQRILQNLNLVLWADRLDTRKRKVLGLACAKSQFWHCNHIPTVWQKKGFERGVWLMLPWKDDKCFVKRNNCVPFSWIKVIVQDNTATVTATTLLRNILKKPITESNIYLQASTKSKE